MGQHVFTYGSLMFEPVWQRVVHGRYRSAPATLRDHRRYALGDDTYPGVVRQAGTEVAGLLYFEVDDADLQRLDAFEGDEYRRCSVMVVARLDEPTMLPAQTYLFEAVHRLSAEPWDPENFALQRFLGSYCRERLDE